MAFILIKILFNNFVISFYSIQALPQLLVLVAHFSTDEGRSSFLFRPKYLLFKFLI